MQVSRITRLLAVTGAGLLLPGMLATALETGANADTPPHGTISTVAGGPGGPAKGTSVSVSPCTLDFASGNLYFASRVEMFFTFDGPPAVYRLSQSTGALSRIAGTGMTAGGAGNGMLTSTYSLKQPCGTTIDAAGNVIVADRHVTAFAAKTGTFHGIRMRAGREYTLSTVSAHDVQLDPAGNLVMTVSGTAASSVSDEIDSQVFVRAERTGNFYGKKMVKGKLYLIAGQRQGGSITTTARAVTANLGYSIGTVRFDRTGNILLADTGRGWVRVIPARAGTFYGIRMTPGWIYSIATGLTKPKGAVFDRAGNVVIADGTALRVLAEQTGTFYGQQMTRGQVYTLQTAPDVYAAAVDNAGNVLFTTGAGGGPTTSVVMLAERAGSFYGTKTQAGLLYTIAGNGRISYSGDGGPAGRAQLYAPSAVAANRTGTQTAFLVETFHTGHAAIRLVTRTTGVYFGHAMVAGDIYTIAGDGPDLGTGIPAVGAGLRGGDSIAFDPLGNLLISDYSRVVVVAARAGTFYGQPMQAGFLYQIAGGGTDLTGNGVPALSAELGVRSIATDSAGNIFVQDMPDLNQSPVWIRVIAAKAGTFYGQPMTAGDIYTVAGDGGLGNQGDGGPATAAHLGPEVIAIDQAGNLVISGDERVRVVAAATGTFYGKKMTAGDIYRVAGGGPIYRIADGTPALRAQISEITLAVDKSGNLLVGSADGTTVWMVAEKAGTYYGKRMHAGDVYTVAHDIGGAVFRDNCPALRATFAVTGLAVQPGTENLLIADSPASFGGTERIRSVSR